MSSDLHSFWIWRPDFTFSSLKSWMISRHSPSERRCVQDLLPWYRILLTLRNRLFFPRCCAQSFPPLCLASNFAAGYGLEHSLPQGRGAPLLILDSSFFESSIDNHPHKLGIFISNFKSFFSPTRNWIFIRNRFPLVFRNTSGFFWFLAHVVNGGFRHFPPTWLLSFIYSIFCASILYWFCNEYFGIPDCLKPYVYCKPPCAWL